MADSSGNRIVLTFEVDDKGVVTGLGKVKGELGDFKKSADDSGQSVGALGGIMDGLGVDVASLANPITIGVGVFAAMTGKAYELAGALNDLSDKTGLSLGFLQDLKFAGDQVNVPMDAAARGVQQLQKRIVEGGPDITKALDRMHLSIDELRQQTPDQMFESIAKGIADIKNPAERTALATQLMGKSGADLIPLLANFEDLRKGAIHMSDDAAKGFDAIGDAWSRFKNNIVNETGEAVASLLSVRGGLTDVASGILEIVGLGKAGKTVVDALYVNDDVNKSLGELSGQLQHRADIMHGLVPPLNDAAAAQAAFEKSFGTPKEQQARLDAAEKAEKAHADAIQKLADTLTGKDVAQKISDLAAAEKLAEKQGGLTAYQQQQLGDELLKLSQQGAKIPPVLQPIVERAATLSLNSKLATDGVSGLNKELKDFPSYGLQALPTFDNLINRSGDLNKFLKDELGPAIHQLPAPPPDPWQAWHDGVKDMLDGPNGLVENMGTTIGSLTHGWDDFWGNLKQTAQNTFDDIVNALIHQFLDPMLAKIIGSQSAFGHAINGLFTGAGPSGSNVVPSGVGTVLHGLTAPGTTTTAGGGSAFGSALGTVGAYAGPALAVLTLGAALNGTGLLGQGSFDDRDRDAMIAQLGLGQYGYQYSTDQLEAMINSGQIPQMADGGIVHAQPGGGLFRLGEGRFDEMVTPLDPRDMQDPDDRPIRIYLDGREIARNQVRHIPSVLFGAGY